MKKTVKTLTSILGCIFVVGTGGVLSSCGHDSYGSVYGPRPMTYYGPAPVTTPEECCSEFQGTEYEKYYNRCMELAREDSDLSNQHCEQIKNQAMDEIDQDNEP